MIPESVKHMTCKAAKDELHGLLVWLDFTDEGKLEENGWRYQMAQDMEKISNGYHPSH